MARDFDVVSPRGRLFRGALSLWAVLIYVFLFAPIVLTAVTSSAMRIVVCSASRIW